MSTLVNDKILVGVCSVTATNDKAKNIENALSQIRSAAKTGAEWVFLPEMFAYHGPYETLFQNSELEDGPLNSRLSKISRELGVVLFAGSAAERPPDSSSGKVFNTQYVFGKDGEMIAKYRKVHLFNLISSNGEKLYCESDGYVQGNDPKTLEIGGWKIGLATCYDLRFTEFFSLLSKSKPLDLLVIPAAFTQQTGMYHWELLCRARAVENLCYVVASNQTGTHSPGKSSFGHSVIVNPWGVIQANSGPQPGFITSVISKDQISYWRSQLPVLSNSRTDIY
jgi:deaminated glutathione amidase